MLTKSPPQPSHIRNHVGGAESPVIAVVGQDLTVVRTVHAQIAAMGGTMLWPRTESDLAAILRVNRPVAVVVHVRQRPSLAVDLISRIRRDSPALIAVVIEPNDAQVRIALLDAGADQLISWPCVSRELLARLRALLRRAPLGPEEERHVLGPLSIEPQRHAVSVGKRPIPLRQKEFELLLELARCEGAVVPRNHLLHRVWGHVGDAEQATLNVHMHRLRRKLEMDDGVQIETVVGIGYKLRTRS